MSDQDRGTATMYRFAGRDYDGPQALAAGFAELGYPLNEQGLAALAAAVASGTPSHLSMDAINSAYRGNLLAAYGDATGQPRFREIDDRWHAEVDRWTERVRDAREAGGPDVYGVQAWRARAWLLQAILRPEAEQSIRERAEAAMASPAAHRPWFRGVDDPRHAAPGDALAAAMLADAAPGHYEGPQGPSMARRITKWAFLVLLLAGAGYLAFSTLAGGDEDAKPQATASGPDQTDKGIGNRVQQTGVNPAPITMYEEPDTTSAVVQELPEFTVIEVMELAGDWYGIRIKETPEIVGYVEKAGVEIRCDGKCNIG